MEPLVTLQSRFRQGLALHRQGNLAAAERIYGEVLDREPRHFDALHMLGVVALQTRRTERGIELIRKAIGLNERVAAAHNNLGNALMDLKHPEEALASFDRAIALSPDYPEAHDNRGNSLRALTRAEEALLSYDKAITLDPHFAQAYCNRGITQLDLRRPEAALASFDKAILLNPNLAEAYLYRGNALMERKRPDHALASYAKAIALRPDYILAYRNRGHILSRLKRYDEALAAYDKAYSLNPDLTGIEGHRLYVKMHLCDWKNLDSECASLVSAVIGGKANTQPFIFLAVPSAPSDQLQCARLWTARNYPAAEKPLWQGERYRHGRIRIAYLSSDFRQHPASFLMAGMFECHDRSRFETTAISFGDDDGSEIRQRVKASFERFVDAKTYSDAEIADLVRSLEIDIAIDRNGFTTDARTGIFARRPAPVQAHYLGYPGTMGAPYIDYVIADEIVIPRGQRRFYSEKVAFLPNSYHVTDAKRPIAARTFTRVELGLPSAGFVFCCFNSNYKIAPPVFDAWMRILNKVEGSVLWLLQENAKAADNLRKEATARGVKPERLVFASRMQQADHLARHRAADLSLDTLPYNAHTTASDALWAGLPVLTCLGETFVGRVAASLLNAIGLPELITATPADYERLAIDLATNPDRLAAIKGKLANNRLTTALFDTGLFTRHIEAAYTAMYARHQAGLAPNHIAISN